MKNKLHISIVGLTFCPGPNETLGTHLLIWMLFDCEISEGVKGLAFLNKMGEKKF